MNSKLPSYSIAIRTLGTSGEAFRRELESITRQTVKPEKVMVYIAGARPPFTIGDEEYVDVEKGMVRQRALNYDKIESDVIFFLDDDVELEDDSAEKLLRAMGDNAADAVGVDFYANHKMSVVQKIYAALSNLVVPHFSDKWAFKVSGNGSFSYNNRPQNRFYRSQKFDGGGFMVKRKVWNSLRMPDEWWLDDIGFAYADDFLESYKLHVNGYKVGVLYGAGIKHLDAGTASGIYRQSHRRLYVRTKAQYLVWWRAIYKTGETTWKKGLAVTAFLFKQTWIFFEVSLVGLCTLHLNLPSQFIRGMGDARRITKEPNFRSLPPYLLP